MMMLEVSEINHIENLKLETCWPYSTIKNVNCVLGTIFTNRHEIYDYQVTIIYLLLTLDLALEMNTEMCSSPEFPNPNNDNIQLNNFWGAVLCFTG